MENIIRDRLDKIKGLEDRKILKDVLYDVFLNLSQESDRKYKALERRVERENENLADKCYIYTGLESRDRLDVTSEFLHPVILSDMEEEFIDLSKINQEILQTGKAILLKIFMHCDARKIKEMLNKNDGYSGKIITDKISYPIQVTLERNLQYIHEMEKIYAVFQLNGVPWNTINFPYAYKFLNVVLSKTPTIGLDESVKAIEIDLGAYDSLKEINMVPVWNVKRIIMPDKSFPMPTKKAYKSISMSAEDRELYEHIVSLEDMGIQNGFLVDTGNIDCSYTERLPNDLLIISHQWEQAEWKLLQIENQKNDKSVRYFYQVVSNEKDLSFAGRYAAARSLILRTKAELTRFLKSYKTLSEELRFEDVCLFDKWGDTIDTVECNSFLEDNIRSAEGKKFMVLMFYGDKSDYLVYEKMSFLASEVQLLFPEYRCIGKLI